MLCLIVGRNNTKEGIPSLLALSPFTAPRIWWQYYFNLVADVQLSNCAVYLFFHVSFLVQVHNLLSEILKTEKLRKPNIFSRMSSAHQSSWDACRLCCSQIFTFCWFFQLWRLKMSKTAADIPMDNSEKQKRKCLSLLPAHEVELLQKLDLGVSVWHLT